MGTAIFFTLLGYVAGIVAYRMIYRQKKECRKVVTLEYVKDDDGAGGYWKVTSR